MYTVKEIEKAAYFSIQVNLHWDADPVHDGHYTLYYKITYYMKDVTVITLLCVLGYVLLRQIFMLYNMMRMKQ